MAERAELIKTVEGTPGNVPASWQEMAARLRERFTALPGPRRNTVVASVLGLAAFCALMAWYANRPESRILFSGLDGKDVQQVSQELAAANIPYQLSTDGSGIEVPADAVDKARMEVAAKGMPQTGRLGFELFDKPNWVGSEFDEKVNYQRALEGELEHTIGTLAVVRSARVHLVLPQQSLFTSEEKAAKASVVLKLRRAAVDPAEADSIRSLVAGAVENLSPDDVTLVDADGRVNLKPRPKNAVEGDIEQALEAKLVTLLEPLAGRDNVRATVNVNYDQDSEERTDEVFDPTQVATVSMQRSEQTSTQSARPSGVPGTASNTPAASANGAVQGSTAAAAPGTPPLLQKDALPVYPQAGAGQSTKQESGTYAITKHVLHSEQGPGRLHRVTAAILVNDRLASEGAGKLQHAVWKPRSAEEMHRLEELAQAAVGFDPKRGDQVVIENMSFSGNLADAPLSPLDRAGEQLRGLLHNQPGLLRSLTVGLCGVLLVLFVLRPLAQQVAATLRSPLLLTAGGGGPPALAGGTPPEAIHGAAAPTPLHTRNSAQLIFDSVSHHIRREPVQSTRLLETWIGAGDPPIG